MTPAALAVQDHTNQRRKSGVAIATAMGHNWRDLDETTAAQMVSEYEAAWWGTDR